MIWKYWPTSKLQNTIGNSQLSDVEEILPLLDPTGSKLFFLTEKSSLVQLNAAFAPEDYFKRQQNLRDCINFLPQDKFDQLRVGLDLESAPISEETISQTAKYITLSKENYRIFCKLFNLPNRFLLEPPKNTPSTFLVSGPSVDNPITISKPYMVLKNYQSDMYYRALKILEPPMSRMILHMPTGSGKTRTTMEIISSYFNTDTSETKRVVWLANTKELCEQAISSFVGVWQHIGRTDVEVHRIWGSHEKLKKDHLKGNSQFLVGSLQTLWKMVQAKGGDFDEIFSKTTFLVVDEAHIAVAKTYSKTVRKIAQISQCKILGLTATPGRSNEDQIGELSDLFLNEIVQLKDPAGQWKNAIAYLRSMKILSTVQYQQLEVDTGIKLTKSEIDSLVKNFDYSENLLKKIGRSKARSAEILSRLREHLDRGASVLLFAPSLENSKFLTSMLTFLGYRAAHIDGNTADGSRDYMISEFVNNNIQVLCNYGVLTTGFDAPKTDVVCIARPTKSTVLYSQMIGRGLRGTAVGGTDNCTIIEVRDNFQNQGTQDKLYEYFDNYWID